MPLQRRHLTAAIALGVLGALAVPSLPAAAAGFPNGPIKIVVPFPAGGTADFVARLAGERLSQRLGVPVVIDNRVGANGNIGTEAVARADPDGQTLLLGSTPNLAINPSLYRKLGFDPLKDFAPVMQLAVAPNLLVIHPSVPANSVAELVQLAKAKPGSVKFASPGNGSTGHLAMEMLNAAGGTQTLHVPYRGGPQAVTDLLGGQVDALFFTVPTVLPHVKSGRLKALAVAGPQRSSALPDVPTMAEAGMPGVDASPWFGLVAPAATPRPVVERLATELAQAWDDDDVRTRLRNAGAEPLKANPAAFAAVLQADTARWAAAVKRSGATVD